MTLKFRQYTVDDRSACLRVFRSNIPKFFREFEQTRFESFIDEARYPYFVIERSEKIIGCGGYGVKEGSGTAALCWGMVASQYHGQHIGEYLLAGRLNEILRHPEISGVHLSTSQHTDGFYQKYGFTVLERRADDIAPGLDTVEMNLDLTEEKRLWIVECWNSFGG